MQTWGECSCKKVFGAFVYLFMTNITLARASNHTSPGQKIEFLLLVTKESLACLQVTGD